MKHDFTEKQRSLKEHGVSTGLGELGFVILRTVTVLDDIGRKD